MTSGDPEFELPHRGCYFPNWAQYRTGNAAFTANDVDPALCTYVIIAFAKIENNQLQTFESNDLETFKILSNLKKRHPRLKVLLAVGGWTLSHQVAAVASSPDALRAFVSSAVVNLRKWGLDGLDVDWEFPKAEDKEQFSALLKALRIGFESEKRTAGQQRLALTAAVQLLSHGGYDGQVINRTCDIVNIMTYDFHGAWDPHTIGHHSPLFKGPFGIESGNNTVDVLNSFVETGVAKQKISVGIPFYGRGWNVSQPQDCKLGGHADGPISASRCTGETGNWPYHEIVAHLKQSGDKPVHDELIQSTYVAGKTFWIGYDDVTSVKSKVAWVKANQYGGVFAWEVSQDDFHGIGGAGKFPLLTAIRGTLTGREAVAVPREVNSSAGLTPPGSKYYIVKPGDSAYNIAIQYGLTLDQLKSLNISKKNLELIHPGDKLLVGPLQSTSGLSTPTHCQSTGHATGPAGSVYTVQSCDTAYNIALKNGMTLDQLKKLNPSKGTMEMIHPGDKIVIGQQQGLAASRGAPASVTDSTGDVYTVQSGDTAYNVALRNGLTLDQLKKLNPSKGTMEMMHPGDKIVIGPLEGVAESRESAGHAARPAGSLYAVQSGDTAYNIALKNGLTLDQLRKLNPSKGMMEMIHPGDKIVIGQAQDMTESRRESAGPSGHFTKPASVTAGGIYVVQSGDTAYNIAIKNGLTLDQLQKLNPGKGTMAMIHPGDQIAIGNVPGPSCVTSAVADKTGGQYIVQAGDTAYNIALKHGITLDQLKKLNPGKGTMEMIHPGDLITLGRNVTNPEFSSGRWHTVVSGDTAYNIALKNGMTLDQLRKLNPNKGTMEMIHPNERIKLG